MPVLGRLRSPCATGPVGRQVSVISLAPLTPPGGLAAASLRSRTLEKVPTARAASASIRTWSAGQLVPGVTCTCAQVLHATLRQPPHPGRRAGSGHKGLTPRFRCRPRNGTCPAEPGGAGVGGIGEGDTSVVPTFPCLAVLPSRT